MGISKYLYARVWCSLLLAYLVVFAALFWATSQFAFLRKPFAISISAVVRKSSKQHPSNSSPEQHPSNSSTLVDDEIPLWPTALNIPQSPATLFDSELGDLAQRLLDPPVPAPSRPLHVVLMAGLKAPFAEIPAGDRVLVDSGCAVPPNACAFSEDRERRSLSTADVLLWQNAVPSGAVLASFKRPRRQIWAFVQYESPPHGGWGLEVFNDDPRRLNWTSGYRLDSTLPDPYERFVSRRQLERLLEEVNRWPLEYRTAIVIRRSNQIRNYLNNSIILNNVVRTFGKQKDKKVAWFVSNKHANNKRWEYALELSKHIQVDIFSPKGPFYCSRHQSNDCFHLLKEHYKFYLSFENSDCRHYITEKLFVNALRFNTLPIVMGAHPSDYSRSAPRNSYLHVDWFGSPKALANYLNYLDRNQSAYNEYFSWHADGDHFLSDSYDSILPLSQEEPKPKRRHERANLYCRLCKLSLLARANALPSRAMSNVERWWRSGRVPVQMSSHEALIRDGNANAISATAALNSLVKSAAGNTSKSRDYSFNGTDTRGKLNLENTPMCLPGGGRWVSPLEYFIKWNIEQ